jgi:hypothetical protein
MNNPKWSGKLFAIIEMQGDVAEARMSMPNPSPQRGRCKLASKFIQYDVAAGITRRRHHTLKNNTSPV